MIFIDTSFYLSYLLPADPNHDKAIAIAKKHSGRQRYTSQAIIGEILTVGSQRYHKQRTLEFVEVICQDPATKIILETKLTVATAFDLFPQIRSKNISWVDCYSLAIIKTHQIPTLLTFDSDFKRLLPYFDIPCTIA